MNIISAGTGLERGGDVRVAAVPGKPVIARWGVAPCVDQEKRTFRKTGCGSAPDVTRLLLVGHCVCDARSRRPLTVVPVDSRSACKFPCDSNSSRPSATTPASKQQPSSAIGPRCLLTLSAWAVAFDSLRARTALMSRSSLISMQHQGNRRPESSRERHSVSDALRSGRWRRAP
jgi:hypothetical protein